MNECALSHLQLLVAMELISRKISTKDVLGKMMYAYDLATTAERNKTRNTRSTGCVEGDT